MTADPLLTRLEADIEAGVRVSRDDALWLWEHASDDDLARLASRVRGRFHPADRATYLIMAIVNTTNVCVARCDYCAFYKMPGQDGTYLLTFDQLCQRVDAVVALGGGLVGFNGGFHPDIRVEDYCTLFRRLHEKYPEGPGFYEMTVAEFMFVTKRSKYSYAEAATLFREAGTRWITGGGAEILDDAFRLRHSPGKYKVEDYYAAQLALLDAGIGSTATMVIGFDETIAERFNHLARLREFQDGCGRRLPSFLCWTYKPWHTELGGQEVPLRDYLRWLAVCRIFLDNIPNIRTSVLTRNDEAMQGLRYGANDFDLPTEDEVTTKAGATISLEFDRILASARRLGFTPVMRAPFGVPPARAG